MANLVGARVGSDAARVCAFELRRFWGRGGWRRLLGRTLLALACVGLPVLAIDRWLLPMHTFTVAVYAQPLGLSLQVPNIRAFDQLPLWAVTPAYLSLGWMLFLLLLWARVYLAVSAAAAVYRDRDSAQEEMLAISRLSRPGIILGKVLAPALPVALAATLLIAAFGVPAAAAGTPPEILARAWLEVMLQILAVSALCLGAGSLFRRRWNVLLASCAAGLIGVAAVLWTFGWAVHALRADHWTVPWALWHLEGLGNEEFRALDTEWHWIPLLGLGLLGGALANLPAGAPRHRAPRLLLAGGSVLLLAAATSVLARVPLPASDSEPVRSEPAVAAARDDLALGQTASALRRLDHAERNGGASEDTQILRVCALFQAGRYAEARARIARLRPFRISPIHSAAYWGGLAICLVAEGRSQPARRCIRFVIDLYAVQPKPAVPASPDALIRTMALEYLPQMERERQVPARAVVLRWASARYPADRALRKALRDELRSWSGYAVSPQARRGLLKEAGEQELALR